MEIHFCTRCDQSIPEADIQAGEAVFGRGGYLCNTCRYVKGGAVRRPRSRARLVTGLVVLAVCAVTVGAFVFADSFFSPEPVVVAREFMPDNRHILAALNQIEIRMQETLARAARDADRRLDARFAGIAARVDRQKASLAALSGCLGQLEVRLGAVLTKDDVTKLKTNVAGLVVEVDHIRDAVEEARKQGRALATEDVPPTENVLSTAAVVPEGDEAAEEAASSEPRRPDFEVWLDQLSDRDPGLRCVAIERLAIYRGSKVENALIARLKDWSQKVRKVAAEDLGDRRCDEALPALVPLLDDGEPVVRATAVLALRRISGRVFGYRPQAGSRARSEAARRWKAFVEELERKDG